MSLFNAGFALSSIDGRVAIEFFDLSEAAQAKKYVFVCPTLIISMHNILLLDESSLDSASHCSWSSYAL